MIKKMVFAASLTAVALSACGKKYKAAKFKNPNTPPPEAVNESATFSIEEQALKALQADEHHMMYRKSTLSEMLKEEISGVSASLVSENNASKIELSVLDTNANECSPKSAAVDVENAKRSSISVIQDMGRVRCVDISCEHLLVFIEARRDVENYEFGGSSLINGTVAILLKKDSNGTHKPVTTESKDFLQVHSVDVATASCEEVARRPKTGDEFAVEREQQRQEKLRAEEIANRPQTGDEFALERLRYQQDQRLKAIEERLKTIDTRLKEISENPVTTDEPKTLATEKSKLEKERDEILSARQAPVPQEEMVPVDPTLED